MARQRVDSDELAEQRERGGHSDKQADDCERDAPWVVGDALQQAGPGLVHPDCFFHAPCPQPSCLLSRREIGVSYPGHSGARRRHLSVGSDNRPSAVDSKRTSSQRLGARAAGSSGLMRPPCRECQHRADQQRVARLTLADLRHVVAAMRCRRLAGSLGHRNTQVGRALSTAIRSCFPSSNARSRRRLLSMAALTSVSGCPRRPDQGFHRRQLRRTRPDFVRKSCSAE